MDRTRTRSPLRSAIGVVVDVLGGLMLAAGMFLVLPILQMVGAGPEADLLITEVSTAEVPPPPPPVEQEPEEEEPEPEEAPPELNENSQPLDLSQLELALGPALGGDGFGDGGLAARLGAIAGAASQRVNEDLFSLADLDQKPRVLHQPGPLLTAELKRRAPGTCYVLFVVEQDGRVANPTVQSSTDPVFERPAIAAVRQWRFEPGKRAGKPVRFRMRVPITFPRS